MSEQEKTPPSKNEKLWYPLESNPTLLNQYISNLGFELTTHEFVDVYSTEEWALDMIVGGGEQQRPVCAVVALFPMTDKVRRRRREMHLEALNADLENDNNDDDDGDGFLKGQENNKSNENKGGDDADRSPSPPPPSSSVWYVKQRIRNACGTIAILHALANTPKSILQTSLRPNSWLDNFLSSCPTTTTTTTAAAASSSTTAVQRAILLENDPNIEQYHESATHSSSNQTCLGNKDDVIDMHFVTFVYCKSSNIRSKDGSDGYCLYELDGRVEEGPIRYSKKVIMTQRGLLRDACHVIGKWMEADEDEMRFTILALAPKSNI